MFFQTDIVQSDGEDLALEMSVAGGLPAGAAYAWSARRVADDSLVLTATSGAASGARLWVIAQGSASVPGRLALYVPAALLDAAPKGVHRHEGVAIAGTGRTGLIAGFLDLRRGAHRAV